MFIVIAHMPGGAGDSKAFGPYETQDEAVAGAALAYQLEPDCVAVEAVELRLIVVMPAQGEVS